MSFETRSELEVILIRTVCEECAATLWFYPQTLQESKEMRGLPSHSGHWGDIMQDPAAF